MKKPIRNVVASVGLVAVGLIMGTAAQAVYNGAFAAPPNQTTAQHVQALPAAAPHAYAKNVRGMTYGSELDAATPGDAPDLIAAYATNGKLGYIKRTDFQPTPPADPQAALRVSAANQTSTKSIPVYAQDGTTRIGVFIIERAGR
jgi:hypothetical protein